jgi:glycerol kinase
MTGLILGLDQGTSSTRCLALDADLVARGTAAVAVAASFPAPGWVQQDPQELIASAREVVRAALAAAGAGSDDVLAVGIANQTETFVVSDRSCGQAIHPAIVWQDRRSADRCAALVDAGHAEWVRARTGLELDATFPATKLSWLLDRIPGARAAAEGGELAYHDVAGWLLADLCGVDVAEASNAGRTLLCPLGATDWDDALLALFGIPRAMLPPIVDSDRPLAVDSERPLAATAAPLPVAGVLGDQQASLFGLGCRRPGSGKVTLGTGAFILVQAGPTPPTPAPGVLASGAWRMDGVTHFALEGFVPAAGAALSWLTELGVVGAPDTLDALLADAGPDSGAVVCVPALQGFGTPSWDAGARGALFGFTRATTRAQVVRAVIDGVLHQVADALSAIRASTAVDSLLVDGGLSRSDWVMARLAEVARVRVVRAARSEATAIGAAMMAGLAAGVWDSADALPAPAVDLVAEPSWPEAQHEAARERWARAVALSAGWAG